jgi:hypothetical protein
VKKNLLLLIFFIPAFFFHAHAQYPPTDPAWELKFSDEFDSICGKFISDSSKWARQFPFGQGGTLEVVRCRDTIVGADTIIVCDTLIGINYFTRYSDSDDITLQPSLLIDTTGSGHLRLISRKQKHTMPVTNYYYCPNILCHDTICYLDTISGQYYCVNHDTATFTYTTAMLYSKYRFKYGYFELRFKLPSLPSPPATDSGYTYDWWMWNREVPHSNEIDMFEIRGTDNVLTNNLHYKRDSLTILDLAGETYFHLTPLDSNWHIAAMEWAPDKVNYYLDGNFLRTVNLDYGSAHVYPDSMISMPMIIDLDANATNFGNGVDTLNTVFPLEVDIDYVRVYQLKIACDTNRTICNYTTADSIYSSLQLGGTGCTTSLPALSSTIFRANNYIQLNEGFSLDSNSESLLLVVPCETDRQYFYHEFPIGRLIPPNEFVERHWYLTIN